MTDMSVRPTEAQQPAPSVADQNLSAAAELSVGNQDRGLTPRARNYKFTGLTLGVVLALAMWFILPDSLGHDVKVTAAVAVLIGAWWITEAAPLALTALVPLIAFPATGVAPMTELSAHYMSPIILLFLGGFILALALQRWNLHKRLAIRIVLLIGTRPSRLVAGFMIATAALSMWVSNTATAMMMIPMGMSMVTLLEQQNLIPKKSKFGTALALGIAYGASIGGMGTLIGSPVNIIVAGYIRETLEYPLSFLQWMSVGVPFVCIMLFLGWFLLTKVFWKPEVDDIPGGREIFEQQLRQLGKLEGGERAVFIIFVATALSWVFIPTFSPEGFWIDDTAIALIAAFACMLVPAKPREGVMVMTWKDAEQIPWDVLLLIGGGLALSSQITGSGLASALGDSLSVLGGAPLWVITLAVIIMLLLLTELTSTTATTAAFVPVVGGLALALGLNPVVLVIAAGMACTCAFMLPVATPPNALAYSTGSVTMKQMIQTGIWMNMVGVIVVTIVALTLVPAIFG